MIVYQIPSSDIKSNSTIAGSGATPNTIVKLYNPISGQYVKSIMADSGGSFNFGIIDNRIPLVIKNSSTNDFDNPATIITSSVIVPAKALSWYAPTINNPAISFYNIIGIVNLQTPANWGWAGTPTGIFIDSGTTGECAHIEFEMANVGDPYWDGSARVILNELEGGIGKPIRRYDLQDFGRNYMHPTLEVKGKKVAAFPGLDPNGPGPGVRSSPFKYSGPSTGNTPRWFSLIDVTEVYDVYKTTDLKDSITALNPVWGSDQSKWGTYQYDYTSGKFSVTLPDLFKIQ
jgi:hypothetical protein